MKKRNKTTPPLSTGQILLLRQRLEPVLRSLSERNPSDFSYRAKLTDGLTRQKNNCHFFKLLSLFFSMEGRNLKSARSRNFDEL